MTAETLRARLRGESPFFDRILPGVLVLTLFAGYAITVAPTVSFWDAGEFIATSYILGIPHPPATPLYVLIGRIFSLFPIGEIAARVNYLSLLPSLGALLFLYLSIVEASKRWTEGANDFATRFIAHMGAFLAALFAAFMSTYWDDSTEAEVYSLSILIWSFSTWLALRWANNPRRDDDRRPLLLVAYLLSLSIGIHLGTYLALPPFLLFIFAIDRKVLLDPKLIALGLVFTLLGVSVHAFIPIRSMLNPAINEAQPDNWIALKECLLRQQYKPQSPFLRQASTDFQLGMFWRYFKEQFLGTTPGATPLHAVRSAFLGLMPLVGCLGMVYHFRKNRETFALFALQFLVGGLFLIFYMNFTDHEVRERDYFYAPGFFYFSTWIGLGFSALLERLRGLAERRSVPPNGLLVGAGAFSLVFPALLFWHHFDTHDERGNRIAQNYAYNMLASLEKDAIIFTNGDNDTFPLWYLQEVEGVRKDVRIMNLSLLNTPWYIKQLKNLEPKVPISFSDDEIERLRPFQREGKVYLVKDIAVYDIIRTNNFQRPIYYAVTVADLMGFDKEQKLVLEGLVFRIHPDRQEKSVDAEKTVENLTKVYRYEGILDGAGNLDKEVYKDENAQRLISNYSAAWARIAFERRQAGDKNGAVDALTQAGKITPDYRPYRLAFGALLVDAGRLDEARSFYGQSLRMAKSSADRFDALMGLGLVQEKALDYEGAEKHYREALGIEPRSQEPYLSLFQMNMVAGRPEKAADVLREWLDKNPGDSVTRQRLAELDRQIGGARDTAATALP
jgi:tetratricopeptide (TPR) repeat protein